MEIPEKKPMLYWFQVLVEREIQRLGSSITWEDFEYLDGYFEEHKFPSPRECAEGLIDRHE